MPHNTRRFILDFSETVHDTSRCLFNQSDRSVKVKESVGIGFTVLNHISSVLIKGLNDKFPMK